MPTLNGKTIFPVLTILIIFQFLIPDTIAQETDETMDDTGIHGLFSKGVLGTANRFDSFFGDNRSITESNKTRIRVRFDFDLEQGDGFSFTPNFRANISLPKTKEKLSLFINGDEGDEDQIESDIENNEESGTFFLRYYFFRNPYGSLATDTGLRFRSFGVEWFGGLRGRIYRTYGPWGMRLTNRLRWFTERKWTNETRFDLERVVINHKTFFRASTFGRWFQKMEGYFLEQQFILFHKLTDKTGIAPEWRTLAETGLDDFIKETRLRLRIRHNLKWKWLFVEVAPGVVWKEENDFNTDLAIRFRVDAYFGNLSRIKLF